MLPTALVADPNPIIQRQLVATLEPSFRCAVATTLRECVLLLQRERPILLVLDPDQPDGDGMLLIRQLQQHPDYRNILIACVTRRSCL